MVGRQIVALPTRVRFPLAAPVYCREMKNHAKVGNRKGNPAYRTPSTFRYQKSVQRRKLWPIENNPNQTKKS
jgi:hypothetical protein